MTSWTKTNDNTTAWGQRDYPVDEVIMQSGEIIITEGGENISTEGIRIDWLETNDKNTSWGLFGGLIRLCTEGSREDVMTEGRTDYIVVSHGEDVEIWTDTADIATTYTKINDL